MYLRYGDAVWESSGPADSGVVAPADQADAPARPQLPTVNIHGVDLHAVTARQAIDFILDELDAGRGGSVVTPNLDHIRRVHDDLHFGALVAEADLVVADGMPLIWASKIQGTPLPARVAGSDLIWTLSAAAAARGRSVFLLGGEPGTADAAAQILRDRHPSLRIAGTHCPPVGFEKITNEMGKLINTLVATHPDIVFVALGSPKQEQLIDRIRRTLPGAWWLGVGISFSFVAGSVKRAPAWMQNFGLEWVHRLMQEPRRLFKRYLLQGLPFGLRLMAGAAMRRASRVLRARPAFRPRENSLRNGSANGKSHVSSLISATAPSTPALEQEMRAVEPSSGSGMRIDLSSTRNLHRLRAVVLLGGSVRQTELATSIGRSVLDLPIDEETTLLNYWLSHSAELSQYAGVEALPVRIMVNHKSPEPRSVAARYSQNFCVEKDSSEFRGTGGVLRDLAEGYDDNDLILVGNAAQLLMDPLSVITAALHHKRADIALVSHRDGTPSGLMLIRCKTLRGIKPVGFIDLKEQALPTIAQQFDVKVMQCRRPSGLPVRSLADYITALRYYHRRRLGRPAMYDPLAEDWQPTFGIVEDGASVDPRAHVHDSVVLRGAVVEPGASVVRSVVCPGGAVKQRTTAVDRLITR